MSSKQKSGLFRRLIAAVLATAAVSSMFVSAQALYIPTDEEREQREKDRLEWSDWNEDEDEDDEEESDTRTGTTIRINGGTSSSSSSKSSSSSRSGEIIIIGGSKDNSSSYTTPAGTVSRISSIQAWKKTNSDVTAWIRIPGTNIDYAVVKSPKNDNDYYTQKGYDKKYSYNGVIWGDCRNKYGKSTQISKNMVLYGHNWTNPWAKAYVNRDTDVMFAQLIAFKNLDFAKNNQYLYYSTEEQDLVYQVFAVFVCEQELDYYTPNPGTKAYQTLLDEAKKRSLHNYDVEVTTNDKILTLSTCTDAYRTASGANRSDDRFVVMAKLVSGDEAKKTVTVTKNPNPKAPQFKTK